MCRKHPARPGAPRMAMCRKHPARPGAPRMALRFARRWSTLTPLSSPRPAARSARSWSCSHAGASLCSAGWSCWRPRRRGLPFRWPTAGSTSSRVRRVPGAAAVGVVVLAGAAALLARRPALVPIAVLIAAPVSPADRLRFVQPLSGLDRRGRAARATAAALPRAGRRGRRARLGGAARPAPAHAADGDLPAGGGVLRVRLHIALVGGRRRGGRQPARLLHAAVRRPGGHGRTGRVPRLRCARARGGGARAGVPVRGGRPLAGGHARAVLLRAQPRRVEREHRLLPRHVAVRRSQPLRAPCRARHRRSAVAAGRAAMAHLAVDWPDRSDVGGPALLVLAVEHDRSAAGHARRWRSSPATGACAGPWACSRWSPRWRQGGTSPPS